MVALSSYNSVYHLKLTNIPQILWVFTVAPLVPFEATGGPSFYTQALDKCCGQQHSQSTRDQIRRSWILQLLNCVCFNQHKKHCGVPELYNKQFKALISTCCGQLRIGVHSWHDTMHGNDRSSSRDIAYKVVSIKVYAINHNYIFSAALKINKRFTITTFPNPHGNLLQN